MSEKIKWMIITSKAYAKGYKKDMQRFVDQHDPDTYDVIITSNVKEALKLIDTMRPELIQLESHQLNIDCLALLREIKARHPKVVVFVSIDTEYEDDEKLIGDFLACGAYKCYVVPVWIETLIHDFFVAQNMEEL